jgi:hypothetical protein
MITKVFIFTDISAMSASGFSALFANDFNLFVQF